MYQFNIILEKVHFAMNQKKPIKMRIEKNKDYYWCSCGLSNKQPLCDGSHKKSSRSNYKPLKFSINVEDSLASLCVCKKTKKPPFCDGSHRRMNNDVKIKSSYTEV